MKAKQNRIRDIAKVNKWIPETEPKPLYKHGDNEVWDARDYLRPINMTSSQHFWLVMGAVVVSAIVFVGILLLVKHFFQ